VATVPARVLVSVRSASDGDGVRSTWREGPASGLAGR
jgi:hypothetical protein